MSSLSVWSHLFLMLFVICFRWILLRGTLFAMALIQMAGVISIVLDPSVSRALSVVVAVYLLAVVVVTAGLTLLEGPSEAKETSAPIDARPPLPADPVNRGIVSLLQYKIIKSKFVISMIAATPATESSKASLASLRPAAQDLASPGRAFAGV
jgi:hypothetical protein